MSTWVPAEVIWRKPWAPGLVTLRLDVRLNFKPGQFTNVAMERDGVRLRRSYSLASAPGAAVELYVNEVADGGLSPQLVALEVGERIQIDSKPGGFFTLDELPAGQNLWLLATGTGMGPYISMLRSGQVLDRFETVVVVHAAREWFHLGYRAEMEEAAAAAPQRIKYIPVTSREEPPAGGVKGRIPALIDDGQLERAAGLALEQARSRVLLCGNPQMIVDGRAVLESRGLSLHRRRAPGQILTENYW